MANNRFDFLEITGDNNDDDDDVQPADGPMFGPAHLERVRPGRSLEISGSEIAQHPHIGHPDLPETPDDAAHRHYAPMPISEEYETPLPPRARQQQPGLNLQQTQQQERPQGGMEIRPVEVFGTRGTAAGEFNFPTGLAVDREGVLFVADVYNHRVQRITPDGAVAIVGARGSGKTQFLAPMGIACDLERSFYVVEQGNNRVQKFSVDGRLMMMFGRKGERAGEFRAPMGICISPATGEILIADTGNGRVQRFTMRGDYIGSLGAAGSLQPPLSNPQSVACDRHGNIYVADTLANRIARYDPLGRFTGHFGGMLTHMAGAPSPNIRFTEPRSLACGLRGELFVADGNHGPGRLVVMTSDTGNVKASVSDPGGRLGPLQRPAGVAVGPSLRSTGADGVMRTDLYMADTMNHRIIRFTVA